MKNTFLGFAGSLPALIQNTHLNVSLDGWPAAVAVIAISLSSVAAYAIKALNPEAVEAKTETQRPHIAA